MENDATDIGEVLAAEWDERYGRLPTLPDKGANPVLIAEVAEMTPGRALDVGCGLGAEAIWLALYGWSVTAMDVSRVALQHAARRGQDAGVEVRWVAARLTDEALGAPGFDLVTAFYPALRHSDMRNEDRALLDAVAPKGTLLVVHHSDVDVEKAKSYGFDPAEYLSHEDLVGLLDDQWTVRVERRRRRLVPACLEGQHRHDDIIVARRR